MYALKSHSPHDRTTRLCRSIVLFFAFQWIIIWLIVVEVLIEVVWQILIKDGTYLPLDFVFGNDRQFTAVSPARFANAYVSPQY